MDVRFGGIPFMNVTREELIQFEMQRHPDVTREEAEWWVDEAIAEARLDRQVEEHEQ